MDRGEMPIEPGDSWFSPKCMQVQPWRVAARRSSAPAQRTWLGGRALDGLGAGCRLPTPTKLRMPSPGGATSEAVGANLHRQEGNNPDRRLRSLSPCLVGKVVGVRRQPGGWLRSSHP